VVEYLRIGQGNLSFSLWSGVFLLAYHRSVGVFVFYQLSAHSCSSLCLLAIIADSGVHIGYLWESFSLYIARVSV